MIHVKRLLIGLLPVGAFLGLWVLAWAYPLIGALALVSVFFLFVSYIVGGLVLG